MNVFEIATRKKFRFASAKGDLSLEQLWDLPLTSRTGFDLDTIARGTNAALKSVTEESFVVVQPHPRRDDWSTKLEVLKHIIGVKLKEQEDAKAAVVRSEKRRKLLNALDNKEDQALANASKEDILKQLAELDGAAA